MLPLNVLREMMPLFDGGHVHGHGGRGVGRRPGARARPHEHMLMSHEEIHFHNAVQTVVRTGHLPFDDPIVRAMLRDMRRDSMGARLRELDRRCQALPRGKYVRSKYKPHYTHRGGVRAPFTASVPTPPVEVDLSSDHPRMGEPGFDWAAHLAHEEEKELEAAAQPMNAVPVCAACNCALRSAASQEEFFLYFLPCGHVIDGACRDRLGAPKRVRPEPTSCSPQPGPAQGSPAALGKRKRPSDASGGRRDVDSQSDGGDNRKPAELWANEAKSQSGFDHLIPCPVEDCMQQWVYAPGKPTSATRLYV